MLLPLRLHPKLLTTRSLTILQLQPVSACHDNIKLYKLPSYTKSAFVTRVFVGAQCLRPKYFRYLYMGVYYTNLVLSPKQKITVHFYCFHCNSGQWLLKFYTKSAYINILSQIHIINSIYKLLKCSGRKHCAPTGSLLFKVDLLLPRG